MEKEFDNEFTDLDFWDINLSNSSTNPSLTIKLRRQLTESKEVYKELIDYLDKTVSFLIHIKTDEKFQVEGSAHFWVKPKNLVKQNEILMELTMEYDSVKHKKLADLWNHDCNLFMTEIIIQPELITTE
jgi:hypothetical protein